MFVALSKTLDLAAGPLTWAIAALVLAALLRRRARASLALVAAALAVLVIFSADRVSGALTRALERSAVRTARPDVVYDAVIVLGSALDPAAARAHGELQLGAAGERVARAFELARAGRVRSVLVSGGLVQPQPGDVAEAELIARKLEGWGLAPDRIIAEPRSRNTRENAVESARIVAARGWRRVLLVTSAAHMERALGCFRRAGLSPDVLPVDFRGGDGRGEGWLPRAGALAASTDALHELVGRVVYRVMGYT